MKRFAIGLLLAVLSAHACAQGFPARQIHFIVPFPPGGPLDPIARGLAPPLAQMLGQPVVVENRAGATGTIGYNACATAPDAHTICMNTNDLFILPHLMKMPFNLDTDIAPVTQLLYFRQVLMASPKTPFATFREMVEHAKANPGKLNFGSFGEGGGAHQLIEAINRQMGIRVTHIPYKGSGPALQALLAGEVDMAVAVAPIALPHQRAGKLKVLAITGETPLAVYPGVGTYREQGFGLDIRNWFGVVTSGKAPAEQVNRLYQEIARVLAMPDYQEKYMRAQFYEPIGNSPQEFAEFIRNNRKVAEYLASVLKDAGYKAQ
jgi:tripartite-type tricarboxylate transporter receptor subunit TctC